MGFGANLLVAWGLSLGPHLNAPGNQRSVQLRNPSFEGTQTSFFFIEQQWFGVLEQQYYTRLRSRAQPTHHPISFWWAWSPFTPEPGILEAGNELFDRLKPASPDEAVVSQIRYGFPAFSLRCQTLVTDPITGSTNKPIAIAHGAVLDENAIPLAMTHGVPSSNAPVWPHATYIWFPYRPIWSGLIINTLIYTVLLWIAVYIVRSIKHDRRLHRGACPYCAYDLQFNYTSGCPECGWRRKAPKSA